MANSVSVLIEKPNSASTPKVPSSTTGTAIAGISVARQLCRKTNMTRMTSPIASASVQITSLIDSLMNAVESRGNANFMPSGKLGDWRANSARTSAAVFSASAPGASDTAMPAPG